MDNKQIIRQYCQQFKMGGIQAGLDQLIKEAEAHATGYLEFTARILQTEVAHRERNDLNKRFPYNPDPMQTLLICYFPDYAFPFFLIMID